MKFKAVLIAFGLILLSLQAFASVTLYDFEDPAQVAAWQVKSGEFDKVKQTDEFATSGRHSVRFTSKSEERRPTYEMMLDTHDWRKFDRCVVDIVNPSSTSERWRILLDSGTGSNRHGFETDLRYPARGFQRFVFKFSDFPENVDLSNMRMIRIIFLDPFDLQACVDNITLLEPGEKEPEVPARLTEQLKSLKRMLLSEKEADLRGISGRLDSLYPAGDMPILYKYRIDSARNALNALRDGLKGFSGNAESLEKETGKKFAELDKKFQIAARTVSEAELIRGCEKLGIPSERMVVGFAPPTEKFLPRDMPFAVRPSRSVGVSLARNEKESFQVAVMPRTSGLKNVRVSVTDLTDSKGAVFSGKNIDCDVTGYVETVSEPPYTVSYFGWWPDPILDFLGPVDIAPGDLQSFWVRVRAPKDQAPGDYKGKLIVAADGAEAISFDLKVKVRKFAMPECAPLPIAITLPVPRFSEDILAESDRKRDIKYDYADFAGDYYMDIDSLYNTALPDFEILKYMHDRGRLVSFNLGLFYEGKKASEDRYRPIYEKVKEMGLLDHAYIYGYDEANKEMFHIVEEEAALLKKAFPEVIIMTTCRDKTYGLESPMKSIDAWCPLTPDYKPDLAEKTRAEGRYVWWYICCSPHHPYANWFIEYPGIETRLIFGPMTAKYRPDGFLYYATTKWNKNKPITSGPFTKWNPVSYTTYHGDGSLFCAGPGGKPVPTVRLENYRDGMEDYAYFCILSDIVKKYEAKGEICCEEKAWLNDARAALAVPDNLVHNLRSYTHDPKELFSWRERMADLIDVSGMADADPWGSDFGVRGFRGE